MTPVIDHQSPRERTRNARLRAADTLRIPSMRLHLILAATLCLCFWVGIVYIGECTFAAIPWESLRQQSPLLYQSLDLLFYVVDAIVILLVGLPLLFGTAMIYQAAADGQKLPLTTLFHAFSSAAAYHRALGIMITLLMPSLLTLTLVAWLFHLAYTAEAVGMTVLFSVLATLLALGMSVLLGRDDVVLRLAYLRPNARIRELFSVSHRLTHGRLLSLWLFKLTYLGWALLSLLSLGIVLLLHALPAFVLSHAYWLDVPQESDTST